MRHFMLAGVAGLCAAIVTTSVFAAVVPPSRLPRTPASVSSIDSCSESIPFLNIVRREQIMAVDWDNTVVVLPICQEDHLGGNVSGLLRTIGANEPMTMALEEASYRVEDVVAIRFGGDGAVLLYVME